MTLHLSRLTLSQFRSHPRVQAAFDGRPVALFGDNGAGKTNLLEAVSLLSPGRGLRRAAPEDLIGRQAGLGWRIEAELQRNGTPHELLTEARPDQNRSVRIDGKTQPQSALGQLAPMLWLTPAMDRLFAGPASDRRRFLDRLVTAFDPEHGSRILVFEKVMRERNLLLDDARADLTWMSSLEAHMAEAAVAIAAARLTGLEALQRHVAEARSDSSFPWGDISVDGEVEGLISTMPAVRVEDEYRKILRDSRGLDRAAGRTLRGPHRSDLVVVHGPKQMAAELCSTGEQKALLIGLILAQARAVKEVSGVAPVLLLDEVAAHLDLRRRKGLFEALAALGSQSWMTGTDASLFDGVGPEGTVLHVEDGNAMEVMGR